MKEKTSKSYRQRLATVVDYIYDHLDTDLDVNTLADIALMSPYHFHRIYRELAQETINSTVRRLRLQRAAAELISSELSLSEIAKEVSYGSLEAFSRAFAKQFGESPSDYRETRRENSVACNHSPFIAMLPQEKEVDYNMFNVEMINFEALDVAYYSHQGEYIGIGAVFEKLFMYGVSQNLASRNTRSFGLFYDDPESVEPSILRSKACATLPRGAVLTGDDAPKKLTIPAGLYATLLFKGSYAELQKPYNWLFGEWLPNSGYEAADFPPMDEYLNDPNETPPSELLTRIYCLLEE